MSHETASLSSSRSSSRPTLPPFLHLATQENGRDCSDRSGGAKPAVKNLSGVFRHAVFPGRFGAISRLERVAEATLESEKEDRNVKVSRTLKRKTAARSRSRRSTSSPVLPLSTPHISAPRRPQTLITSHPPLNVSDIPLRSPTNKSPFSAVLLAREDEGHERDDPALALRHTEQLHRARLAKLTRHLGEEIPADLVFNPVSLSPGSSLSFVHSHRGSNCHHRRRSLDPSTSTQEISTTQYPGCLRGSKSFKEQGDTLFLSPATGIIPEMPCADGDVVGGAKPMINTPPAQRTAQSLGTVPELSFDDVLRERVSADTHSEDHLSQPSPPSLDDSHENFQSSLRTSRTPSRSRTLPRRPATADASRRVEKLANFFGVDHDDVLAIAQGYEGAGDHQISHTSVAGDLAVDIRARPSQVEVEVRVSQPARFWNGRTMTKSVHPEDVLDELRMMKAS